MTSIPRKQLLAASPHLFARDIYGLRMSPAHQTMMDHIVDGGNRSLLLCQRGLGKSLILQSYICWFILNNPNKRVILVSSTDGKASSFMRAIKQTLESQNVQDIWGDVKGSVWTDHELTLSGRTSISAEPSLMCLGAGSGSCTGRHCDLLVTDDLCDFDSTRSELQRNRLRDWLLTSLSPVLMANGTFIAAGTRYHYMDIWQLLLEKLNFNTLILHPIKDDGTAQCEFLQPIDDVFDDKGVLVTRGLKSIKRELGSVIYALQYENNVSLLLEGNIINHENIQYTRKIPNLESIVISCDPAISKKDGADYTAIIVGGRAADGGIYIKDYINEHLSFKETIDKLKSLVNVYNPVEVRIEQVGFSEGFVTELKRELPGTLIKGIKPVGDKESRLREVSPIFENMLVWFLETHSEIVDQLLLFPDGDHDDLCDAIQIFLHYYKTVGEGVIIW